MAQGRPHRPQEAIWTFINNWRKAQRSLQDKEMPFYFHQVLVPTQVCFVLYWEKMTQPTYIDSYIHTSATSGIIGTNVKHIGHNDIDLNTEQEQEQKRIDRAIESLGHMIFHYQELNDYKRTVAEKMKEKGINDVIIKECLVQ